MATTKANPNGHGPLEQAIATLIQNQAQFVRHLDEDRKRSTRAEKEVFDIRALILQNEQRLRVHDQRYSDHDQRLRDQDQRVKEHDQRLKDQDQRVKEHDQRLKDQDQRAKDHAQMLKRLDQTFSRMDRIEQMLKDLPEAVKQKIGFKTT